MRILSWIAASLILLAADANARQSIQASDGDTVTVRVSQTDLTRFRIEGGRIKRLLGVNNVADVHTDEERGEIAIRPRVNTPFSFFLTTSSGDTFTVLATPVPIPSETVIISPRTLNDRLAELAPPPTTPHVQRIKRMIRAMTDDDHRYRRVTSRKEIPLWREFRVT
ncbi:MAG TPA: hypothetical protein ENK53_06025, partial [Thiotrichales bacterium]|nr:hypothetical protein [Thiotrichales bacterium]